MEEFKFSLDRRCVMGEFEEEINLMRWKNITFCPTKRISSNHWKHEPRRGFTKNIWRLKQENGVICKVWIMSKFIFVVLLFTNQVNSKPYSNKQNKLISSNGNNKLKTKYFNYRKSDPNYGWSLALLWRTNSLTYPK